MTEQAGKGVGAIGRARASVAAIEALARIREQARTVATDAERVILAGFSGWGPLAKAFAPEEQAWADMAERIKAALPEQDVQLGMRGTYNAFYTPRPIAAAMWDVLGMFGFDGGPVAELGCGAGVFLATAPDGVPLVGVDRDPTAAAICKLLNPHARVINAPLEEVSVGSDFAAVVGNVPFGDVKLFDPTAPGHVVDSLHNYFIWRATQALTPGGYAVLLTSRYTMDAYDWQPRAAIGEDADFVGAVRLPNGALEGGTDVAADIVILRRKGGTKRRSYGHGWQKSDVATYGADVPINEWWTEEPGAVLGTMKRGSTNRYGLGLLVEPNGKDVVEQLRTFVRRELVPAARERNLMWTAPPDPTVFDVEAAGVVSKEGWHEGTMRLTGDGGVLVVTEGKAQPLPRPGPELLRLLRLRDLAVDLVKAEADHSNTDSVTEPIRADVRAAYEDYVKHHGPLNRYTQRAAGVDPETGEQLWSRVYPTVQGFREDPDAPLVYALEVFADDDGDADEADAGVRAAPAPIQTARQNVPPVRHTTTDDPQQALAWCLDRNAGKVDLAYIARLLRRPIPGPLGDERDSALAEVAGLLGETVFLDPTTRRWVIAEEYCSGDVRGKLLAAQTATKHDAQFARNTAALEKVLPRWLGPGEIVANLGTPWIGPTDVKTFIAEVIGYSATVKRVSSGNNWEIEAQGALRNSVAASAEWGTAKVDAFKLVQLALNGKTPAVYKTVYDDDGEPKSVKDQEASMLAAEKQQELRARFSEWVWECPERTDRLVTLYNHRYNNLAPRKFSGEHITIDGIAPGFKPYAHQPEYVARALVTSAALCGLPVGAGKTNIMAMVAIKLKQAGLVRKPMIVVPNHLIEQIDREIRQLFPAARILSASSSTFKGKDKRGSARKRRSFTARCTTGDWDIVLVTHSAFNLMDVDPETQARYVSDQEQDLYEGLVEGAGGSLKGRMVKNAAKLLDRLRANIKELRHTAKGRDVGIRFEQLGVDYVCVDEFHYYKNLSIPCRTEGFSVRPSKRATDLDMKLRYLRARNSGGPHASLFSGTPISNTMLELYVCMHYTMRPYLKQIGIGSADEWAAAYVRFVSSAEVTVDGGDFQMRTRPAEFVNAPELRVLLSQVADIRTAEQLGLKRPASELRIVPVEPTDTQQWYSSDLVDRAEDVRSQGRFPGPGCDNMLKICSDGRRMATDPTLVGLDDDGYHKLHVVAENIISTWQQHPGKLQIAFLDIGTPTKRKGATVVDYQTYGRLRRLLTEAGMDVSRIRFIHDAKDDNAKAQLFRDCKRGKVDVIFGSTDKLGVGTNIQRLVVAMHHIDAPFRPADVEQRDGRGLRPGNINKLVTIFRYVTKRTFDAYMWQMLTRKLTFISQMLSGNLDRTVEDVTGDDVLSFAAIKAAATDQPLLQEKAEVETTVKKLRLRERAHRQTVARMRKDAPRMRQQARKHAAEAGAWEAIAKAGAGVEVDDDMVTRLHESMARFKYYVSPVDIGGGVMVGWRQWQTQAEEPEPQPLMTIDGGGGQMTELCYRFWKPVQVKNRIRKVLENAADAAALQRDAEAKLLAEATQCDALAEKPFEHAAEITAARARLDQIEAALNEAASGKSGPNKDAGDVVVEADAVEIDLGEFGDFAGMVMGNLEEEVAAGIAAMMGSGFGATP